MLWFSVKAFDTEIDLIEGFVSKAIKFNIICF